MPFDLVGGYRGSPGDGGGLARQLLTEQPPGQRDTGLVADGKGLGAAQLGDVGTAVGGSGEDLAFSVEVEVADVGVGEPAQRLEGDVPGVADDDEPGKLRGGFVEAAAASLVAVAVFDDEVKTSASESSPRNSESSDVGSRFSRSQRSSKLLTICSNDQYTVPLAA